MKYTRKNFYYLISALLLAILLISIGGFAYHEFLISGDVEIISLNEPSNITSTDSNDKSSITLTWNDTNTAESGYKIERTAFTNTPFEEISTLPANSQNFTDNTIAKSQRYFYRVRAYSADTYSAYSNITSPVRTEKNDLLLGWDNFENSSFTRWGRMLTTDGNSKWTETNTPPMQDGTVADGWFKGTNRLGNSDNTIFNLVPSTGINNSKSQYIGIKGQNVTQTNTSVQIYSYLPIKDANKYGPHHGDKITLQVDKIYMKDFENLPNNSSISFYLELEFPGNTNRILLDPNTTPFNKSITVNIPATTNLNDKIIARIGFSITGNIGLREPGIFIDGAHLFVTRSNQSSYETIQIPAPRNRNITTQMVFFENDRHDPYIIARDYDSIMAGADQYAHAIKMKYYNPTLSYYTYECVNMTDYRSPDYEDTPLLYRNAPLPFGTTSTYHPEWFYSYPTHTSVSEPPGDYREEYKKYLNNRNTKLNYVFEDNYQTEYYAQFSNILYQQAWIDAAKTAVPKTSANGIFVDCLGSITKNGTYTDPVSGEKTIVPVFTRFPWEAQSLSHAIAGYFNTTTNPNFDIMMNQSDGHYSAWPARAYFDPNWTPENPGTFNSSESSEFNNNRLFYSTNNPTNTPKIFFQEHAYMTFHWVKDAHNRYRNAYNLNTWLKSVEDIEQVESFNNQQNNPKLIKIIYQLVHGEDRNDDLVVDPAFVKHATSALSDLNKYDNGWAKFGFTSYLLSNNKYSFFGVDRREQVGLGGNAHYNPINPGYNLTTKLGNPIGRRIIDSTTYTDSSLQHRQFSNGIVVVNGSPDLSRKFTLTANYTDEYDRKYPKGFVLTLKPHSGRFLFTAVPRSPANTNGSSNIVSKTIKFKVSKFHYNARGSDWRNLNDEYVVIKNIGNITTNLYRYKIKNKRGIQHYLPKYRLKPNSSITVHTGYKPKSKWKSGHIYLQHKKTSFWSNKHDTLYLYNSSKKLVLKKSY